jgi:hypothetical protein
MILFSLNLNNRELPSHQSESLGRVRRGKARVAGARFRTFHFQKDPLSPKLREFLEAKDSENWSHELYAALKAFFERNLPIKEFTDSLSKGDAQPDDEASAR